MYGMYITFQAGRPLGRPLRIAKKHWNFPVLFSLISGFLSSQGASPQVLSAFAGLTAVFGMGTGGSPQPSPLNVQSCYTLKTTQKSIFEPLRSLKPASYLFTGQFYSHLTPSHNSGVSDLHIFVRLFVPSKLVRCLSQVLGLLVPVRSMCCHTSTPGLSTMSSTWDLTCLRNEKPHL